MNIPFPAHESRTAIRWRHASIAAGAVLGLLAWLDAAAAPRSSEMRIVELAVETTRDAVVLPSGPASALVVTPCTGCRPLSLTAAATTHYSIDGSEVSLAELRNWLRQQREADIVIFYARGTRALTRVLATARGSAP